MRRLAVVSLVAGAALISSILATPAFSQSSGEIAATVTAAAPCISIASGTLGFPSRTLSTSDANSVSEVNGPTVTNCSTVPESVFASATDAAGTGAGWFITSPGSLSPVLCAPGGDLTNKNRFALNHFVDAGDQRTLGASLSTIKAAQPVGALAAYKLQLYMPCTSSDGIGTTMSFTITFTATIP
ncbi:MAG: hypothetical protein C0506_11255 [Anaerolinea sp.]|nr:hypothetical protein [Anaerolinea sp.]